MFSLDRRTSNSVMQVTYNIDQCNDFVTIIQELDKTVECFSVDVEKSLVTGDFCDQGFNC